MLKTFPFLFIAMLVLAAISCKEEPKNTSLKAEEIEISKKSPIKKAPKKELTPEDIEEINSVMSRIMKTGQLETFASYTVNAGLAETLFNEKGPVTIFAPSNAAIDSLSVEKKNFYTMTDNRPALKNMLNAHIVEGNWSKDVLNEAINKSGKVKLKSKAGTTLTASKSGEAIVIANEKGKKATVINGSIKGSNGELYVIDAVLNEN
jgi:uncharacterized surface protein with fasciclin (FAS1) repeats